MATRIAQINVHRIIRSTAVVNRSLVIPTAANRTYSIFRNGFDMRPKFFSGNTASAQNFDIDLFNEENKRRTINRLLYRSKQRGFLELDLVLGNWVEENVNSMDENTVKSLIHVLNLENPDLWKWLTDQEQPPEAVSSNPVFSALHERVMNNLNKHSAPETRAAAGQPWVKGWDDFKKGRDAPIAGNQLTWIRCFGQSPKPCSLALPKDSPLRVDEPNYVGIRRFMLKLLMFYSKQSMSIRGANVIYKRIVAQVDKPAIYDVFNLEKTFKITFSLFVLDMWLVLRRLKEDGKEGVDLGQYVYEIYNHDMELRVSKAGVNLLLAKWMKELERIFYGNVVAYDAALLREAKLNELQIKLWRQWQDMSGEKLLLYL